MLKTPRQTATDRGRSGQALVEFALVMPLLMLLVMALFELALLFNAFLGVNRESQDGAHLAAISGPLRGRTAASSARSKLTSRRPSTATGSAAWSSVAPR